MKLDTSNKAKDEYKIETIWDSVVYIQVSESGYLLELYYLISWKGYFKEKNTWEPASAVQYLQKLINLYYKDYLDKLIVIFLAINIVLLIIRSTIKPAKSLKLKQV